MNFSYLAKLQKKTSKTRFQQAQSKATMEQPGGQNVLPTQPGAASSTFLCLNCDHAFKPEVTSKENP